MKTMLLNNRYQVIKVLGTGGFGETFLASDTHIPSCRYCAIKQLKATVQNPQTYQLIQKRFEREAVTLELLGACFLSLLIVGSNVLVFALPKPETACNVRLQQFLGQC